MQGRAVCVKHSLPQYCVAVASVGRLRRRAGEDGHLISHQCNQWHLTAQARRAFRYLSYRRPCSRPWLLTGVMRDRPPRAGRLVPQTAHCRRLRSLAWLTPLLQRWWENGCGSTFVNGSLLAWKLLETSLRTSVRIVVSTSVRVHTVQDTSAGCGCLRMSGRLCGIASNLPRALLCWARRAANVSLLIEIWEDELANLLQWQFSQCLTSQTTHLSLKRQSSRQPTTGPSSFSRHPARSSSPPSTPSATHFGCRLSLSWPKATACKISYLHCHSSLPSRQYHRIRRRRNATARRRWVATNPATHLSCLRASNPIFFAALLRSIRAPPI